MYSAIRTGVPASIRNRNFLNQIPEKPLRDLVLFPFAGQHHRVLLYITFKHLSQVLKFFVQRMKIDVLRQLSRIIHSCGSRFWIQ